MRLIDADALAEEFVERMRKFNSSDFADAPTWNDAVSLVVSAPTIDPPEVLVAKITVPEDQLQEAIKKAIADMEPESPWIPVTEELPEAPDAVLVTIDYGGGREVSIGEYWSIDGVATEGWGDLRGRPIIAWMPLPEPYQGDTP